MFNPFSDNIIFFDSEFSSNDPETGEILSLAMIKMNGEELYMELDYKGKVSDWVKTNVLPFLTEAKVTKIEAKKKILDFVGDGKPYLMAYVNQFDFVYLSKIIPYKELPFSFIPMDFATIMFALGINPYDYMGKFDFKLIRSLGVDPTKYKLHHALDDTRLLREVYLKLVSSKAD